MNKCYQIPSHKVKRMVRPLLLFALFYALCMLHMDLQCDENACAQECGHFFTLAPEFSSMKRTRKGGTEQEGTLIGARFNYDHIKRYKFYWGLQAYYGSGEMRGKNASAHKLHSRLTEEQLEANVGYTLAYKKFPFYTFTPFFGAGYFRERNHFHYPSLLEVKFSTNFWYGSFGFLSHMQLGRDWLVGANARFKLLYQAECRITNDPTHDNLKQQVGDRMHYRVELPIGYIPSTFCQSMRICLMPFYEFRIYGGRENYPFDFFETKYRIYGIDLQFIYEY